MTTSIPQADIIPVKATEDLSDPSRRFKAINLAGTIAADVKRAAGVLINAPKTNEFASAVIRGVQKVMTGGAVSTLGFPITITASGFFIAASSGGLTAGRALETCNSGDLVQAAIDLSQIGFWGG